MSRDQMQDVFPIVFEFRRGEQPTAEKLTGLVKHTDAAFARMNQAIGDPWDYAYHVSGSTPYLLSPANLGINSLSRNSGPSDYLSSIGGCWSEPTIEAMVIKLDSYKNSWSLGFPLVKIDASSISPESTSSVFIPLVWPDDIVITTDTAGALTTKVASLDLVNSAGKYFVDSYRGVITSYSYSTSEITLTIGTTGDKINMLGAGVPWGTHNVIPTWEDTANYCVLAAGTPEGSQDVWTLTLPRVLKNSRIASDVAISTPYPQEGDIGSGADATWYQSGGSTSLKTSGYSSSYRLPLVLLGLDVGTVLPEGFCQLWDDAGSRFVPLVEFRTLGTSNTLKLVTPSGWLTGSTYRLVVTGTSVAENLSYLNMVVRSGHHAGLVNVPAVSYLPPISHDNLAHRYAGSIPNSTSYTASKLSFSESTLPVNPHSQYLHRYGYHAGDLTGNSANAMRGDLVFTGSGTDLGLGSGVNAGAGHNSFGVMFGGGDITETEAHNAKISLQGMNDEAWSLGVAKHFPFSVVETGLTSYESYSTGYYGALSINSWLGSPLWLRGIKDIGQDTGTYGQNDYHKGASLAFDIGWWGEYNHIKVSVPIHNDTAYEAANMPAETGHSSFGTVPSITPSLSNRLSPYQIREFRFRGGAYIYNAANKATGSLGVLSGEKTASGAGEFDAYFTSPGMVGCDFLNVYSNAIFFSDTGDGKRTSFTNYGEAWLKDNGVYPSGMYFVPRKTTTAPYFSFVDYDSTLSAPESHLSTSFGYSHGFYYNGVGAVNLTTTSSVTLRGDTIVDISTGSVFSGNYLYLADSGFYASGAYFGSSTDQVTIKTTGDSHPLAVSTYGSSSDINILATSSNINLTATTGTITSLAPTVTMGSDGSNALSMSSGTSVWLSSGTWALTADTSTTITSTNINLNAYNDIIITADSSNGGDGQVIIKGGTDSVAAGGGVHILSRYSGANYLRVDDINTQIGGTIFISGSALTISGIPTGGSSLKALYVNTSTGQIHRAS